MVFSICRKEVLVIGAGSIGIRHKDILEQLGCNVRVMSRRAGVGHFSSLTDALQESFDLIVIANETSLHIDTLLEVSLRQPSVRVFVEKPLCTTIDSLSKISHIKECYVGYSLRFHVVIEGLKKIISETKEAPHYAHFHVGQDLAQWRQGRQHQESYSAQKSKGGGVVHDLSHEIDLALWLFGDWQKITSFVGRVSDKTIDSDDIASIIAITKKGFPISINMNYLDNIPNRIIQVSWPGYLVKCDLLKGMLTINNQDYPYNNTVNQSYTKMWASVLSNQHNNNLCTLNEAVKVQREISGIYANSIS